MVFDSDRPTTPDKNASNRPPEISQLHSTPSNHGSASVAEHLTGARVDDVRFPIFADIKNCDTCTVDSLLKGMLSLLLKENKGDGPTPPADNEGDELTDLLGKCLEAVLPICNKNVKVRSELDRYRQTSSEIETNRYEPFVCAFNGALEALRDIDVPTLQPSRKATEDQLLFHRNDPMLMRAAHNGHQSDRKPDVILVSLKAARNARSEGDQGAWVSETAAKAPKKNFEWKDCFCAVEFKKSNKTGVSSLLNEYSVGSATTIAPQLPSDSPSKTEDHGGGTQRPSKDAKLSKNGDPHGRTSQPVSQSGHLPNNQLSSGHLFSSHQTGSVNSSKRKSCDEEKSLDSKKRKLSERMQSLMAQGALYAAERMSCGIWITHAINLAILDEVAYVWWYDSQGAIQSYGIDFIKDLPHFLVLLLCFERFSLKHWGIVSEFVFSQQEAPDRCQLSFPGIPSFPGMIPSGVEVDITLDDKIRGHYGIKGRATQMLHATSISADPRDDSVGPGEKKKSLEGQELVVKVYWPEVARAGEAEIIEKALQIAGKSDSKRHLPDLICSRDFDEYSTEVIRKAFGIKTKGHRVLRIILFRRLYPITDLIGDQFWNAFWDCFRCHHRLWLGGVQHNDISVKNLMYDRREGNCGVLNDYDLAHLDGQPRPSGFERTGTMPFMALDLLTDDAMDGKVERLYRHDCESFAWVLLWICCRYEGGKEIGNAPLSELNTHDYKQCFEKKYALCGGILDGLEPTISYRRFWRAVIELLPLPVFQLAIKTRADNRKRKLDGLAPQDPREPTTEKVFEDCRNALEISGFTGTL